MKISHSLMRGSWDGWSRRHHGKVQSRPPPPAMERKDEGGDGADGYERQTYVRDVLETIDSPTALHLARFYRQLETAESP